VPAAFPFDPGGKSSAPPSSQLRLLHLPDDLLGFHGKKRFAQGTIPSYGQIVLDPGRVDAAVVPENDPRLLLIKGNLIFLDDLLLRRRVFVKKGFQDLPPRTVS